jgi:WD40 repeat protein
MDAHLEDLVRRLGMEGPFAQAVHEHLGQERPDVWRRFVARQLHRLHRGGAQALLSAAFEEGGAIAEAAARSALPRLRRVDRVVSRPALQWVLEGPRSAVRTVCWSALGLTSLGDDGAVRVWDLSIGIGRVLAQGCHAIAADAQGLHLVLAGEGGLRWFSRGEQAPAELPSPEGTCTALAVSTEGCCLWGGSEGQLVRIDRARPAVRMELVGHRGPLTGIAFVGATRAVSGSLDRTLRLWDVASCSEVSAHREPDEAAREDTFALGVRGVAGVRDGRRVFAWLRRQTRDLVDYYERDYVAEWDLETGVLTEQPLQPDALCATDQGLLIAARGAISWAHDPGTTRVRADRSEPRSITAMCALPDGLIVTGSANGLLRGWNLSLAEGPLREPLRAREVFFPPGSREPVSVDPQFNGAIYMHPLPEGDSKVLRHRVAFHGTHVIDGRISTDRRTAVATGHAFVAQWIDPLGRGLVERELPPHHVAGVTMGRDGETVFLYGKDRGVMEDGRQARAARVLYEAPCEAVALAVTPEGHAAALHGDGVLRVANAGGLKEIPLGLSRLTEGAVRCSVDGSSVYVFAGGRFLAVDRETGAVRRANAVEPAHQAEVIALSDGSVCVVGWSEVQHFDPRTMKRRSSHTFSSGVRSVLAHPSGGLLIVSEFAGQVSSLDLRTHRRRTLFRDGPDGSGAMALHPDGDLLACGDEAGAVRLWSLASGDARAELRGRRSPVGWLAFDDEGRALTAVSNESVMRWSLSTGEITHEFKIQPPSPSWDRSRLWRRVAGRADRLVVIGGVTHTRAWSLPDGAPRGVIPWEQATLYGGVPVVRPGGRGGAIASANQLQVLGPRAEVLHEFKIEGQFVSVGFAPDGEFVLGAFRPRGSAATITLCRWDLRTGSREELATREAVGLHPHPDGETALWACASRVIEQRTVQGDQLVRRFVGHRDTVTGLCVSEDGRSLVSVSEDRSLRWWSVETGLERARYEADEPLRACAIGEDEAIAFLDAAGGYGILTAR